MGSSLDSPGPMGKTVEDCALLFDHIAGPIREELGKLKGVKKIDIDLTFEPPWSPDTMSEEAKIQLGFS